MGKVTIATVDHFVFGTRAGAVGYLSASLASAPTLYVAAATGDTKRDQALVMATRAIAAEEPELDGVAIVASELDTDVPAQLINACYELAALLVEDPQLLDVPEAGTNNVKRINAKGVEVEFWTSVTGGRFPIIVHKLLAPYLPGSNGTGLLPAGGTGTTEDTESSFHTDNLYPLNGSV